MVLIVCHVHKHMVEICDMFKIDNKTAVCLKKTIFRKQVVPVLHVVNRLKITLGCMYSYLSWHCFNKCHAITGG